LRDGGHGKGSESGPRQNKAFAPIGFSSGRCPEHRVFARHHRLSERNRGHRYCKRSDLIHSNRRGRSFAGVVPDDVALVPQRGKDFGQRLRYTTEDLFAAGFSAVCLIDSDSPTVPKGAYVDAVQRLLSNEDCAVLGPSDDGGYYLLGLNAAHPRLFEDIAWSTTIVAEQTRQRAREIDLPVYSLPTWFDVDDRQTLGRLYWELVISKPDHEGFAAMHTFDFLRTITDQLDEVLISSKATHL
jgi:Uncharacterized protein conserved in bacteria (DUF2064)